MSPSTVSRQSLAPGSSSFANGYAPRVWSPAVSWGAVFVLLIVIAAELFFSTRQESQTFDESTHLFAGFEYWKHGDFGRNPEHPPLVKFIAAAPLLPMHLKEPPSIPIPYFKAQDFVNGGQLLYGGDADGLLMRGRGMVGLFSLVLAVCVFLAGREMFGTEVGLLALFLLAFEPVFLANGALITTDVPLTCLFFLSIYSFYRYVNRPSSGSLALCALFTGLGVISKHSGALVLPTLALLGIVELLRRPAVAAERADRARRGLMQNKAAAVGFALLGIAVATYVALWAVYGFRYAARPGDLQMVPSLADYSSGLTNAAQKASIAFCARHHLLPEAYLYGWVDILRITGERSTFVFGKLHSAGVWFFFPAMFLVKTTLTLMVLLLLAPFARIWGRSRELLFLVLPAAVFLIFGIVSKLNLGVRHILPIYPFCILLAAAAAWEFARRSRAFATGIAALLLFAAASSLHAFPDYLAYSNEAFGGPSNTYRVVTDSNADWGQGLKWTKRYLDQNHVTDCWFDNSSMVGDPKYYGITCKPLPNAFTSFGLAAASPVPSRISGTIVLSGTEIEGLLWGPDVLNPYEQFKHIRPDAELGNVVMVYHGSFDVPLASAWSHAATAIGLMRRGRIPEALAEAQTAANLAPESASMQATLGQALMAAGRVPEGQQAIGKALYLAHSIHPEYQKFLLSLLEHGHP